MELSDYEESSQSAESSQYVEGSQAVEDSQLDERSAASSESEEIGDYDDEEGDYDDDDDDGAHHGSKQHDRNEQHDRRSDENDQGDQDGDLEYNDEDYFDSALPTTVAPPPSTFELKVRGAVQRAREARERAQEDTERRRLEKEAQQVQAQTESVSETDDMVTDDSDTVYTPEETQTMNNYHEIEVEKAAKLSPLFGYLQPLNAAAKRIDLPRENPKFIVGREDTCDLVIKSSKLSRTHCEISWRHSEKRNRDVIRLRDLSHNHTYVDGKALECGQYIESKDGCLIGFATAGGKLDDMIPGNDEDNIDQRYIFHNTTDMMDDLVPTDPNPPRAGRLHRRAKTRWDVRARR